jgi:type IV secretion system protein VirD4
LYAYNAKRILSIKIYREKEAVFGDSRWATQEDVKVSGLRSKEGMLLGKDEGADIS